jgi:TniQ
MIQDIEATDTAVARRSLPVRPCPIDGEATIGFLVRVARGNGYETSRQLRTALKTWEALTEGLGLSPADMKVLFGPRPNYWGASEFAHGLVAQDFNHSLMRWCPLCLRESAHIRGQWVLKLHCVCLSHAVHLCDCCPACGLMQRLERSDLERCVCGAQLAGSEVVAAPPPLVRITHALEASFSGKASLAGLPLMSIMEWPRLAKYLGQFSETFQPIRPGQIAHTHQLEVATALMLGISHLLDSWPANFHSVLAAIHPKVDASASIRRAFGSMYRVLYAELRATCFQFLRDEFERYLHQHWWGVICKRNRSFTVCTLATHPRITLKQAAQDAGVAPSTVRRLVQADLIPGDQVVLPSGHIMQSIHQFDVARIGVLANQAFTMAQAAKQLALPERRMRELIASGIVTPLVSRVRDKAAAWLIPLQEVQALFFGGRESSDGSSLILVGQLLQYWRLRDGEFIALVHAIASAALTPVSDPPRVVALGKVLLSVRQVRDWLSAGRAATDLGMSVNEAAHQLALKQQVAYDLVRHGLLVTTGSKLQGRRITGKHLDAFQSIYISLADISRSVHRAPRWVLQNIHAAPISGPSIDGSRQYFFRRADVCGEKIGVLTKVKVNAVDRLNKDI